MGSMLWQVSLLILIISVIDAFIRRWAWPQVRYALWLLVLAKLILPPTWNLPSSLISRWEPLVHARIEQRLDISPRPAPGSEASRIPSFSAETRVQPLASSPLTAGRKIGWKAVLMLAWILGMGLFIGLLALRITRIRRWHKEQVEKKSIPVWYYELLVQTTDRLKLGRLPAIVFSMDAKAPAVYGIFRPVLLLPARYLDSLNREDAEHVLLHELAHLKRGDLWLHGLCLLLQIVYWFNPLLLWMRRQMKHVREICCDLTIANLLREKTMQYRETLMNTARELLTESAEPGMGLLGVFEDPFRLVARLKWLEKKTWRNRKLMTAVVVLVTLAMTATVLPMGRTGRTAASAVLKNQVDFRKAEEERLQSLKLDVTIKHVPPLYAAVLPRIGGVDEFEQAILRLKELMKDDDIRPTGSPFGRYLSSLEDVPKEEFVWYVGFPVKPGTKVKPPLEILQISEQQVASASVEGIRSTEEVWPRFATAIQARGYIPAFPPAYELWQGEEEGQEFWWKTEMQIQVFEQEEGYPGMDIGFKETDPFIAVVLPMHGSFAQLGEGARLLNEYIQKKGIQTSGPPFGRYFTDGSKVPPSRYVWELGYPLAADTSVDPPFEIRRIEGEKVAFTTLPGPPEPEYPWAPFILQVMIKGYLPFLPAIEIWHGNPQQSGDRGPRMELQIPVISFMEDNEDRIL
jgi:beta-lactamase regulating signal transducer with metallopeptidase domain/DNA gyrase inhibitor GyrI